MIDSRDIKDLHPIVASLAKTLIERAKNELGIKLLITSTLRDNECQAKLYAKGRTTPGPKVTNAKPGQSFHNYGVAFDVVPVIDGKAIWSTSGKALEIWQSIGKLGKEIGLVCSIVKSILIRPVLIQMILILIFILVVLMLILLLVKL